MQLSHISFNRKRVKLKRKAAKLSERERPLWPTNDHLAVIASIDVLSGVPNRRGFGSRLDFRMGGSPAMRATRSNDLVGRRGVMTASRWRADRPLGAAF
jgi:predicted signal transduction protein with EAL and GGDEF domain